MTAAVPDPDHLALSRRTVSPVSPCDVFVVVGLQTLMGNRALTALKVEAGGKNAIKHDHLWKKKGREGDPT